MKGRSKDLRGGHADLGAASKSAAQKAAEAIKTLQMTITNWDAKFLTTFFSNIKKQLTSEIQSINGFELKKSNLESALEKLQSEKDFKQSLIDERENELNNINLDIKKMSTDLKNKLSHSNEGGLINSGLTAISTAVRNLNPWGGTESDTNKSSQVKLPAPLTESFVEQFEKENAEPAIKATSVPKQSWTEWSKSFFSGNKSMPAAEQPEAAKQGWIEWGKSFFGGNKSLPKAEQTETTPHFEIIEGHLYPQLVDGNGAIITNSITPLYPPIPGFTPSAPLMSDDEWADLNSLNGSSLVSNNASLD